MPVQPWFEPRFDPPTTLDTDRVHLEPLAARHAELDFAALMGSREHLQRTLRWGDWPRPDFTLEENRQDLERHYQEFVDREGYAYTVLTPDRARCVGCVYLDPLDGEPADSRDALLAYWVVEDELATGLDDHLLTSVLSWLERDWVFERLVVPVHADNPRGVELARAAGLAPTDQPPSSYGDLYVWTRPRR